MNHDGPMEPMGSMESMNFHANVHNTILFEQWHTMTWKELLGSCIGIAIIAAVYEGLKVGREYLEYRMLSGKQTTTNKTVDQTTGCEWKKTGAADETSTQTNTDSTIISIGDAEAKQTTKRPEILSLRHILQTGLHFVQLWMAFCLMLVFMTYNVYLCLAITVGGAAGYFCFAWMRPPTFHPTVSAAYSGQCCN